MNGLIHCQIFLNVDNMKLNISVLGHTWKLQFNSYVHLLSSNKRSRSSDFNQYMRGLHYSGAWTLQETHRNSTSYARDEARTSERLLDQQMP